MGFGNIQGIGQPFARLYFEHCGVAPLYFANALGMDAGLGGHRPLAHSEG